MLSIFYDLRRSLVDFLQLRMPDRVSNKANYRNLIPQRPARTGCSKSFVTAVSLRPLVQCGWSKIGRTANNSRLVEFDYTILLSGLRAMIKHPQ